MSISQPLPKIAPTVYDILEATVKAAVYFTEADAGHIFLHKRIGKGLLVSHQCLVTDTGAIIRQYKEDRPMVYGPCNRALEERQMYNVYDARSNPLHQRLLAELKLRAERAELGSLKRTYLEEYCTFLAKARSYIVVPIRAVDGEPIGCIALYSYRVEDYFGTMRKRIIEEYLNNFASSLIIGLIEKASRENQRMKDLLDSYGERLFLESGIKPDTIFDARDGSDFQGVGSVIEHILRRAEEFRSWNDILDQIERFLICYALLHSEGQVNRAFQMLRMPKRTFYNKVKRLGIDVNRYIKKGVRNEKRAGAGTHAGRAGQELPLHPANPLLQDHSTSVA